MEAEVQMSKSVGKLGATRKPLKMKCKILEIAVPHSTLCRTAQFHDYFIVRIKPTVSPQNEDDPVTVISDF